MRVWTIIGLVAAVAGLSPAHAANVVDDNARLWPRGVVPVLVCDAATVARVGRRLCRPQTNWLGIARNDGVLGEREAETIRAGIRRWNALFAANLRLRETEEAPDGPALVFRAAAKAHHCSTERVGYFPNRRANRISIGEACATIDHPGSTGEGVILHEIMHAVGLYHEQQREDSDEMFALALPEAARARLRQWLPPCAGEAEAGRCDEDEAPARPLGPYDFESIMHYPLVQADSGRARVRLTDMGRERLWRAGLEPVEVGQRRRLSPTDIAAVRRLYPDRQAYGALTTRSGTRAP